jgi:hypothetical protein
MKSVYPLLVAAVLLPAILVTGCAKVPTAEVDAVTAAMASARDAEAEVYAADALRAAETAKTALDAELKTQEEKFALMRNYDAALGLAQEAQKAAMAAQTAAQEGKVRAQQEAQNGIAMAEAALTRAQEMLAKAPKGKGSTIDLQILGGDVTQAGSVLTEAKALYDQGKFLDAKQKANVASSTLSKVVTDIEAAQQASGKGRGA